MQCAISFGGRPNSRVDRSAHVVARSLVATAKEVLGGTTGTVKRQRRVGVVVLDRLGGRVTARDLARDTTPSPNGGGALSDEPQPTSASHLSLAA